MRGETEPTVAGARRFGLRIETELRPLDQQRSRRARSRDRSVSPGASRSAASRAQHRFGRVEAAQVEFGGNHALMAAPACRAGIDASQAPARGLPQLLQNVYASISRS